MIEEWKDIPGYEGRYQVSNVGRVKSLPRITYDTIGRCKHLKGKIITLQLNTSGYPAFRIWSGGKGKTIAVHRLLALAFIPNPDNKPYINHLNGVRTDNRVDNLEWCTPSENSTHACRVLKSVYVIGSDNPNAKLNERDIFNIRLLLTSGLSQKDIAERYNVTQVMISRIKLGKAWSHV